AGDGEHAGRHQQPCRRTSNDGAAQPRPDEYRERPHPRRTSSDAKAFPLAANRLAEVANLAIDGGVDGLARGLEVLGNRIADLVDGHAVAQRVAALGGPLGAAVAEPPRFLDAALGKALQARHGAATARALARHEGHASA